MNKINATILGVLCLVGGFLYFNTSWSAEFMYMDYPYHVFNDEGVVRYCIDVPKGTTEVECWSEGVKEICTPLSPVEGYIDCKDNEVQTSD